MSLEDLIEKSVKDEKKIREEHLVLENYQRSNPWVVNSLLSQLKEEGFSEIPTFEEAVSLREDYLLTDLSKIYKQIKKRNPLLIDKGQEEIYFYSIKRNLYKQQQKKGLSLGDKDIDGSLVSGSNLILEVATVKLNDFLYTYYQSRN